MSSTTSPRDLWPSVMAALAVAAVSAVAGWVVTVSLQSDLAAAVIAGAARRRGLDPYVNYAAAVEGLWDGVALYRHSRFFAPPLTAELMRPLAALPYLLAKALFTGLSLAAWAAAAIVAVRMWTRRSRDLVALLGMGALFAPLYFVLERGQVDLMVLLLVLLSWRAGDRWPGGLWLLLALLLKPGLVLLLPFLAVLRRWRVLAGTAAALALAIGLTAALSGPRLLREYGREVLPRVARFGDGGPPAMLLPKDRLTALAGNFELDTVDVGGRAWVADAWPVDRSASVARWLAPHASSRSSAVVFVPALLLGLALVFAAARSRKHPYGPPLTFCAGLVLSVIASPVGSAMGLVLALTVLPLLISLRRAGELGPRRAALVAAGLLLCALPPPFHGSAALGGTILVLGLIALQLSLARGRGG